MTLAKRPKRAKTPEQEKKIEDFIGGADPQAPDLKVVPKDEAAEGVGDNKDPKAKPKSQDYVAMNFSVPTTVKRRFETAKFNTGKKMVEVLEEALTLWENKNSK